MPRAALALALLACLACADSPTAPPAPAHELAAQPAGSTTTAATVPPAPEPASITAAWSGLDAYVTNHTDRPAWIEVEWSLQQPGGRWWTYWREAATIRPGGTHRFRPDCVFQGVGEVSVRGHGLWHRERRDDVGVCY